jgi:hypothetical protein
MDPQAAATMSPSHAPDNAALLEPSWPASSGALGAVVEDEANRSAPIESYDSRDGVCNELARIAFNRSAVMEVYDSMFPKSGLPRSLSRRTVRDGSQPSWVQRALSALRGAK